MGIHRALYITFMILYLITLAIVIWFLLYYSGVPSWVFGLYAGAIFIVLIGILIKEWLMKKIIKSCDVVNSGSVTFWSVVYLLAHIIALALFGVAIGFTIAYSSIPAWIWIILGIAVVITIISTMILTWFPGARWFAGILGLTAFILFIVGLIFLVIYSSAPAWIWGIIALMIVLAIITNMLEPFSDANVTIIDDCNTQCPKPTTCNKQVKSVVKPNVKTCPKPCPKPCIDPCSDKVDLSMLPTANIPEQIVV